MTTKPSQKSSGKSPRSLPPRPAFELDALLSHRRAPSKQFRALIASLPPEIGSKFVTLHELIEKRTQAEMVCAYQVGMIVHYLGKGIGSETNSSNLPEQFLVMATDLSVEAEYFAETLKLVEVFDLPNFGELICKSPLTWQHVRHLLKIEAPATQHGLIKRIVDERLTVHQVSAAVESRLRSSK